MSARAAASRCRAPSCRASSTRARRPTASVRREMRVSRRSSSAVSRPAGAGRGGERRHGPLELRKRLRREGEVAPQGAGDGREVGLGALAFELGLDLVLRRQGHVAGDDRQRVERELGDGAADFADGAQDAALADLDQRHERPLAGRRQHPVAGLAGRPRRRRGVAGELTRQLRLPLVAAMDGVGPWAVGRLAGLVAGGRRRATALDRDHDAVAAVAAPADQAGRLQVALVGVEVRVGHVGDLATAELEAGEPGELAQALEGGAVGGAELGLYLHGRDVTSPGQRRGAAAARRARRAWSAGRGRLAPRRPS